MKIFRTKESETEKIKRLEQMRSDRANDVRLLEAFQSPQFATCWKIISEHLESEKSAIQAAIETKMGSDINADYMLGRLQSVDRLLSLPGEIRATRTEALEDAVRRIDEIVSVTKNKVELAYEP
jgi:hypothetical protein